VKSHYLVVGLLTSGLTALTLPLVMSPSPMRRSAPSCSLMVSPTHARPADTVLITYDLTGLTSPGVFGETRFGEEGMGRSLRIRDESGTVYRLQPKPMHLLGMFASDIVRDGHLQYRLRWPNSMLGLVDSTDWQPTWLDDQDTTHGRFTWPLGKNTVYADLLVQPDSQFGVAALRAHFPPPTERLLVPCEPALLDIVSQ
jgi:hypothetical protein